MEKISFARAHIFVNGENGDIKYAYAQQSKDNKEKNLLLRMLLTQVPILQDDLQKEIRKLSQRTEINGE